MATAAQVVKKQKLDQTKLKQPHFGPGHLRRVWRSRFHLDHCYCALDAALLIEGPTDEREPHTVAPTERQVSSDDEDVGDQSFGGNRSFSGIQRRHRSNSVTSSGSNFSNSKTKVRKPRILPRPNGQPWSDITSMPPCCLHELILHLPNAYTDVQWKVIYCTDVEGFSLPHLYRHLEHYTGAGMLVVEGYSVPSTPSGMKDHTVFGAFLPEIFARTHASTRYFGTREMFTFRYRPGSKETESEGSTNPFGPTGLKCFHWTPNRDPNESTPSSPSVTKESSSSNTTSSTTWFSRNERFIQTAPDHLTIGEGAFGPAIRFGIDLTKGTTSARCETFANCNELIGQAEYGLPNAEFTVSRLTVFSLDTEIVRMTTVPSKHHKRFREMNQMGDGTGSEHTSSVAVTPSHALLPSEREQRLAALRQEDVSQPPQQQHEAAADATSSSRAGSVGSAHLGNQHNAFVDEEFAHPESDAADAHRMLDHFIVPPEMHCGCSVDERHHCPFLDDALHTIAFE